jgi:hypothetical protein
MRIGVAIASVLSSPAVGQSGASAPDAIDAGRGPRTTRTVSLDGSGWLITADPKNVGRRERWYRAVRPDAKRTRVPWIIQDPLPGYHGVAWYWRSFTAGENPHVGGRWLLRFWAVDYKADVWLNGTRVGEHEGGETPFLLDVTDAVKLGAANLLAVRVLNPTHTPIDGIVLNQTPHRNKVLPYSSGSAWDQGGIVDSVELLAVPAVRIDDLFVRGEPRTGLVRVQVTVRNVGRAPARCGLDLAVAPAAGGEALAAARLERDLAPGQTLLDANVRIEDPRPWELNDPYLYRVTARLAAAGCESFDERSARLGFRDFRFRDGWFRLNGRRLYLRCSHTGNCCPVGLELPHDPDLLRRDLINAKMMGFNAIRFIAGVAKRYQLDLCDEIGLMVYEESYAAWCLADSARMAERFNESVLGMVRRDRNHASLTIWGLLNETPDGPVFRHAVALLPALRKLDDSRLVMLNSGRWDAQGGATAGLEAWRPEGRVDPCVSRNATSRVIQALGITWAPGQLSFHPGAGGEYSAVRWTAPAAGKVAIAAEFKSIAERATTDVHVLHNARALFDGGINVNGAGPTAVFRGSADVKAGDTIDFAVGYGNGNYGADTTALAVSIRTAGGKVHDAAGGFSTKSNPNGVWSYGQLAPGRAPRPKTFTPYAKGVIETRIGSLSSPGSAVWEDLLSDQHPYQRVPHTAGVMRTLRTIQGSGRPVFLSEYGIGSAVDLLRVVRLYEQIGKGEADDARFYRAQRDRFLADWSRWHMAEAFDRPEDFFARSNARMAGQRLLGLNAIRSNPNVVGYSLTGTVDQGMTGEGLWTTFREPKPGTADAVFDGLAPLRWCLFAEPVNVYRKRPVRLEAVLANEDVLRPGKYPVRFQVVGPGAAGVFERTVTLTIPDARGKRQPPMAIPVLAEDVVIDGPRGRYRFLATFLRGAAAAGEAVEFHVADPSHMPRVEAEVVLWGDDRELAAWLARHRIRTRPPAAGPPASREVILASGKPPAGGAAAFADLARRVARGCTVVFLSPSVFAKGNHATGWLPLTPKGTLERLPSWLYHKDEWSKRHPIFAGLPAGGLMDYTFYREIIPDVAWCGQPPPAEAVAGAINAAQGYSSGLLVAVHELGAGRFVLNTLRIRENLGPDPAAERLLRNMLNYAAADAGKPLAPLPGDFEATLKALGYLPPAP